MKHVAIFCGGSSYEHEVSIITGIQVAENIDRTKYTPHLVYFDKNNRLHLIKNFTKRSDFKRTNQAEVSIVRRGDTVVLEGSGLLKTRQQIDLVYLAFHGGTGESGQVQGMLEVLGVPFTSPSSEGSVIAMNKALTKEVLRSNGLPVLDFMSVRSDEYQQKTQSVLKEIHEKFSLPVIIKPVHLGSSIGIEIAHTEAELEKYLAVATRVDTEVLIESALQDFTEYNVSVRTNQGEVQLSPIEEPKREDEILSFEDKYTKGGKKGGAKGKGASGGGMEMLDRTVPADISKELASDINELAKRVYRVSRLAGLVRIDFLYHGEKLYCTEINPIPGSMSFYLWEPTGEQFKEQISISLEDALSRQEEKIEIVPYETDIVEKFTKAT